MTRRLLSCLLFLHLACAGAHATSLPPVGQRVSGALDLLDRTVPLPPGEWQVAAAGYGQTANKDPGPYGAIGGVLLLRTDSDQGEFLLLHSNVLPVRAGWGQPPECTADDALFQSVGEPRNLHNACSFVVATRRSQLLRSRLPGFGSPDDATRLAEALPSWALIAGFRVSDRRDMLDIRYGIAPAHPDPSAWFTPGKTADHAHRVIVTSLSDWAQQARQSALSALRDPAEQAMAMPILSLGEPPGHGAPAEQISALRLALYKLATYRLPATTFTLAVSSIAAGNIYLGGVIAFWQSFTHSGVYLGNELAWEWPRPTPSMPFVATPTTATTARAVNATHETAPAPVRLAANSSQLPASALAAHGVFAVDGKQIPLPPGSWNVLAAETQDDISGTVLGQTVDGALRGLVVIHSNATKTSAILGPSAECRRGDIVFAVTRYDTPEDGFCAYGKRVAPGPMPDNILWQAAWDRLAEMGINLPPVLTMVGTRARTQENFIDARYYFAATPTAALQDWADLLQEPLERGVRGRLAGQEPMPWPSDAAAVQLAMAAQSHAPLQALAAKGAIDAPMLDRQIAQADAAMADREVQHMSLWSRSFFKVATYRVAAYADTFAVQTFFTASPAQGVAVASIHAVAKPVMAYVNELYWAHSASGKAPATLLSASFPEIGAER